MEKNIKNYLRELKEYGIKNNIPNVTETNGQFLNMLIKIKRPKNILEIGTANGYSTIWMAEAAKNVGAKIFTIEYGPHSVTDARNNIEKAGLSDYVEVILDDALNAIPKFPIDLKFDFVFIDGEKRKYLDFWNAVQPRLSDKAIIVVDDMIKFAEKTKSFSNAVELLEDFDKVILPIDEDDGILLLISNDQFPISS